MVIRPEHFQKALLKMLSGSTKIFKIGRHKDDGSCAFGYYQYCCAGAIDPLFKVRV